MSRQPAEKRKLSEEDIRDAFQDRELFKNNLQKAKELIEATKEESNIKENTSIENTHFARLLRRIKKGQTYKSKKEDENKTIYKDYFNGWEDKDFEGFKQRLALLVENLNNEELKQKLKGEFVKELGEEYFNF